MLELAFRGSKSYWSWLCIIIVMIGAGISCYYLQWQQGLTITGLSRDVSWGFYVAQLTFLVGIAASAVMLVLPYYLHDFKAFGRITIIGEFVAVAAICMCLLFLFVDLGKPMRALNIFFHPTPNSIIFWDAIILMGYLLLNIVVGWNVLEAERHSITTPAWIKPLIYVSIPWAFTIHTVTAFLYCGLPGRGFWLTAIMAPRFLASAFTSGPALLILLCLMLKRLTSFDAGKEAVGALAKIATYALLANIFFLICEVFVAFYSGIPEHMEPFIYLYKGLHDKSMLVFWMRTSLILMGGAMIFFIIPKTRSNEKMLAIACTMVFVGTWIDKGLGLVAGGFIPSPLHHVTEYVPTKAELTISMGVYGIGILCLTLLLKITVSVKKEVQG